MYRRKPCKGEEPYDGKTPYGLLQEKAGECQEILTFIQNNSKRKLQDAIVIGPSKKMKLGDQDPSDAEKSNQDSSKRKKDNNNYRLVRSRYFE